MPSFRSHSVRHFIKDRRHDYGPAYPTDGRATASCVFRGFVQNAGQEGSRLASTYSRRRPGANGEFFLFDLNFYVTLYLVGVLLFSELVAKIEKKQEN